MALPQALPGLPSRSRWKDVAVVVALDELALVGGRPTSGRDRRRFERFAHVREGLPSRGRSHPHANRLSIVMVAPGSDSGWMTACGSAATIRLPYPTAEGRR